MKSKKNLKIKKNLIVLGSNGMLGKNVCYYFHDKYNIIKIKKRINPNNVENILKDLNKEKKALIINCIGKIPQKKIELDEMYFSNYIFPKKLSETLNKKHLLIHPSTDCVFSGISKKSYSKKDKPDPKDHYGISKYLAENTLIKRKNTLIIRVSIIGKNSKTKKDLLTWFLYKKKEVNGFENHYWNGITTLEWCKKIDFLILNRKNSSVPVNLVHLGTKKKYSKYEVLNNFKDVFQKKIKIKKIKLYYSNKCLIPDFFSPSLREQLTEFKSQNYYEKL